MTQSSSTGLQPPEVLALVDETVQAAQEDLKRINTEIFQNPEVLFKEFKACKLLCDYFEGLEGWAVERGVYGLETAFSATFSATSGSGPGRTVCFNAEYDALNGDLGHGCGHNLIAVTAVASALATAAYLVRQGQNGTVIVMGTPGEEGGGGKYIMAQNGAWARGTVDAVLQTHPMNDYATPMCVTRASRKLLVRFRGKSAHAAAAPWMGRNACDAIVQAYVGIGLLRQQIDGRPVHGGGRAETIQGVIKEAGKLANVIPDYSEGAFSIRTGSVAGLERVAVKVEAVFEAAATATGCEVEVEWGALYEDVVTNETLAEQYRQYMLQSFGMPEDQMLPLDEARVKHDVPGSTDFGSCTYRAPGIHPTFNIRCAEPPHTHAFRESASTSLAFDEAITAAKANALVAIDVLSNDTFAAAMKTEFDAAMERAGDR